MGEQKDAVQAPERFSLNQRTVDTWSLEETISAAVAFGIRWIAVWRHKLDRRGLDASAELIRAAGLQVSSVCRGGFFTLPDTESQRRAETENRAALEEAAALGAPVLPLVCGPAPDRDLERARAAVARGIDRLVPHAQDCGVKLAIEPLHPMLIADRSVIVTLAQANDLAELYDPADVGVAVDVYHVFWDPDVEEQIERAAGRILGFHVSDWVSPQRDITADRAMMGDGIIDIARLRAAVDAAGYDGPIEVEVINDDPARPPDAELLATAIERFSAYVL